MLLKKKKKGVIISLEKGTRRDKKVCREINRHQARSLLNFFFIMQVWNKRSIVTQTDAAGKEKKEQHPKCKK